ncbi:MAG: PilZ domain-containing protein [Ectothiorhodospiraceae bacterium]|jgi:hypothetical protein
MKDARRRPRDVVDQFLPVIHRKTGELIGYLTDVTVDGGMVESEEPPAEGALYPLRMELAESIAGENTIDVDARCVWIRKDRNAIFHYCGFEFHDADPDTREKISELAERYRLTVSR